MYKNVIRSVFRSFGLEVSRYSPVSTYDGQLAMALARHRINLILDVGANTGQFAVELRQRMKYRGRIISYEPMASAHEVLCKRSRHDPLWEIAPRAAIGATAGSIALNIAGNSVSSSVLPMLETHSSAAPRSRYVGQEDVPITTLDSATAERVNGDERLFLKVDTQGYEAEVLKGAQGTLRVSTGVQLELSLIELYAGQMLMPELVRWMEGQGFDMWAISPAFVDPATGRLLQVDATFFRRSA